MYLTLTKLGRHPIVRGHGSRSFKSIRFCKFASLPGGQFPAYREAMNA